MKRKGLKDQRGFTLIELLVAVFILSVGLLAIVSLETTAVNSNSLANKLSVATSLAQAVMEDLLARNVTDPILNTPVSNATYYGLDPNNPSASNVSVVSVISAGTYTSLYSAGTYTATYSIQPTSTQYVTEIDVTVTGGGRTVTLTGYKRLR